jgi:hypothetical protein
MILREAADTKFVDERSADGGLAADAEQPRTVDAPSGQVETLGRRPQNQRMHRAGVEQHRDRLVVDRSIRDQMAALDANGPFRDPRELAAGRFSRGAPRGSKRDARNGGKNGATDHHQISLAQHPMYRAAYPTLLH